MVMYDNEYKTTETKNWTKDKIELQHILLALLWKSLLQFQKFTQLSKKMQILPIPSNQKLSQRNASLPIPSKPKIILKQCLFCL